ncbi:MAG: cytochrome-c peroxidase [Planctomycetia bacterium]|nr:cytochrome-c peroxidase [Planctomycetia bacterium]
MVALPAAAQPAAERPAPRPERSAAERAAVALRLRQTYRADPATWPAPHVDPGVEWREIGLLPRVRHPEGNPFTAAKAELGRTLFHDPRLSAQGTVACVSCHDPRLGWADGRPTSAPAVGSPPRNAPTIRNAAFQPALLWDGRAASLEEHAEIALTGPREMAADRGDVERFLSASAGYRALFSAAYPGRPITFAGAVAAVACFERTVVGGRSRFDAFLEGDAAALSAAELLGLDLFRGAARCMNCHHGPTFSDGRFHDLGLSFHGRSNEDLGRFDVTADPADKGRFRTPSLRDVTQTGPLMHNGRFTLAGVLRMYDAGMVTLKRQPFERAAPDFPVKSPHLRPLGLNRQDLADLEAFLHSLEEPPAAVGRPPLPALK